MSIKLTPDQVAAGMTVEQVEANRAAYWERKRLDAISRDVTIANGGPDPWPKMPHKFRDNADYCERCGSTGCDCAQDDE